MRKVAEIEITDHFNDDIATEKEILEVEKNLGIKIPESYRLYLKKYGLFSIYPNEFECSPNTGFNLVDPEDKINGVYLEGFSGLKDIESDFEPYRIPKDLLTIARCDGGGNRILIGLYGDKEGKIYYWDHNNEQELDDDYQSYVNIYYLCDSFEELINPENLLSYDDEME